MTVEARRGGIVVPMLLVVGILIAVPTVTHAQSFNVDFGVGPSPSAAYGAAAGQAGVWNVAVGGVVPLLDLVGGSTSVSLLYPDAGWESVFDYGGTTGDDEFLLDDFFTWPPTGPLPFVVRGLAPGAYEFFSYSFAPNGANSWVDVPGSPEGFQLLGGAWPGSHQLGLTYALHTLTLVEPADVTINVGVWNGAWGGFNGLQIVRVPEPSALVLLVGGALGLVSRRRA
jgi:hypothetical protein